MASDHPLILDIVSRLASVPATELIALRLWRELAHAKLPELARLIEREDEIQCALEEISGQWSYSLLRACQGLKPVPAGQVAPGI
jgi:hypothetical protein